MGSFPEGRLGGAMALSSPRPGTTAYVLMGSDQVTGGTDPITCGRNSLTECLRLLKPAYGGYEGPRRRLVPPRNATAPGAAAVPEVNGSWSKLRRWSRTLKPVIFGHESGSSGRNVVPAGRGVAHQGTTGLHPVMRPRDLPSHAIEGLDPEISGVEAEISAVLPAALDASG